MDPTVALLTAYVVTVAAVLIHHLAATESGRTNRHQRELHGRNLSEHTFAGIIEHLNDSHRELVLAQQRHLEAMTAPQPDYTPGPPTPQPNSEYLFGEAANELNQFHDTVGAPPVEDTPDWTDALLPDGRGDEPRVASVRPGDSIVPGQGNWNEAMAEGRAVQNGGVVSGEDQWDRGGMEAWTE